MRLDDFLHKIETLPLEYDFSPLFIPQDILDLYIDDLIYPVRFQRYIFLYSRTKELNTWFPRKRLFDDAFTKHLHETYEESYERIYNKFVEILNTYNRKLDSPIPYQNFGYNYICNRLMNLLENYDIVNFTDDEVKIINDTCELGYIKMYDINEFGQYLIDYKNTHIVDENLQYYTHWKYIQYTCEGFNSIFYPESDEMAANRVYTWYEDILKKFHKEKN